MPRTTNFQQVRCHALTCAIDTNAALLGLNPCRDAIEIAFTVCAYTQRQWATLGVAAGIADVDADLISDVLDVYIKRDLEANPRRRPLTGCDRQGT